jgi:hypothetical protein
VSPRFAPKQDNVNGKQKSKSGIAIEKGKNREKISMQKRFNIKASTASANWKQNSKKMF